MYYVDKESEKYWYVFYFCIIFIFYGIVVFGSFILLFFDMICYSCFFIYVRMVIIIIVIIDVNLFIIGKVIFRLYFFYNVNKYLESIVRVIYVLYWIYRYIF